MGVKPLGFNFILETFGFYGFLPYHATSIIINIIYKHSILYSRN